MKQLFAFSLLLLCQIAWSQDIPAPPNPPKLVNDFAHVMSPEEVNSLERKLVAYDDTSSTQIAVVTVETTGNYPIEDYARKILRDWGVGNKKTNNGIVLLVAIHDHRVRIETGYGMEGAIPDVTASHIIQDNIVPNFRADNYYKGLDEATDALIKAAAGEYTAPDDYANRGRKGGAPIGALVVIFIIIIAIISRINRRGGGGGGMMSRRGFSPWILPAIFSGMGNNSGWGGSGGGGWSGGGGGGGFGGFGGGGGGGGGASGGW